jgi:hypothetical protein
MSVLHLYILSSVDSILNTTTVALVNSERGLWLEANQDALTMVALLWVHGYLCHELLEIRTVSR